MYFTYSINYVGDQIQEYADSLETRIADSEVEEETVKLELTELKKTEIENKKKIILLKTENNEIKTENEKLKTNTDINEIIEIQIKAALKIQEEKHFLLLDSIMDGLAQERNVSIKKYQDSQQLLAIATKDIIYLANRNVELEKALHEAVYFEPSLKPTPLNTFP
jgi:hypothetical protein